VQESLLVFFQMAELAALVLALALLILRNPF
jgi:hypothetical protein